LELVGGGAEVAGEVVGAVDAVGWAGDVVAVVGPPTSGWRLRRSGDPR
jgi:hypothetical protein